MSEAAAPVLTIDGPGGSGKGTVARTVARRLGWRLLDSGVIYRVLAHASQQARVDATDVAGLLAVARAMRIEFGENRDGEPMVCLDGDDVTEAIRTEACGDRASRIAALPAVRETLLQRQRDFRQPPGLVADGRDMGTVVFPDAVVKVFLTASVEERARRRYNQLKQQGVSANLTHFLEDIAARDRRDASRTVSPLVSAPEAVTVDTTGMSVAEVVEIVLSRMRDGPD